MESEQVQREAQKFIREKVDEADAEGLVVGLSGGIDSATCLKLAVSALGSEKVVVLIMPGEPSREKNTEDARGLAESLAVERTEIEIDETVESFRESLSFEPGKEGLGNVRARTRMVYTYALANKENLLVLGTGNRTEFLLGYFTKHGDAATDIAPLLDLYKTEVRQLAKHIGLDSKFIDKKPTAGLWKGQTDEDEIGTSYENMDRILEALVDEEKSVEKASQYLEAEKDVIKRIDDMYRNSEHKREGVQGLELEKD